MRKVTTFSVALSPMAKYGYIVTNLRKNVHVWNENM
jgi:hypothetical protein